MPPATSASSDPSSTLTAPVTIAIVSTPASASSSTPGTTSAIIVIQQQPSDQTSSENTSSTVIVATQNTQDPGDDSQAPSSLTTLTTLLQGSQNATPGTQGDPSAVQTILVTATPATQPDGDISGSGTCPASTVHIAVSDLQRPADDPISLSLIGSGNDLRYALYNFLKDAFGFLGVPPVSGSVDFAAATLLASNGLPVDATGSVNPANSSFGGRMLAIATTYIGNVIPPDISCTLQADDASDDFIDGYNCARQSLIQSLTQCGTDPTSPDPTSTDPCSPDFCDADQSASSPSPDDCDPTQPSFFEGFEIMYGARAFMTGGRAAARAIEHFAKEHAKSQGAEYRRETLQQILAAGFSGQLSPATDGHQHKTA